MNRWANAVVRRLVPLGLDWRLRNEDRRVLEQVIFPHIVQREDCGRILFVGCEMYTRGYNRVFAGKRYATIEPDPRKRVFGAAHHVVDGFENVAAHFGPASLDVIVCNGVFGWGLDDAAAADRAIAGSFDALREGGLFVVGWNDVPERRPFRLSDCPSLRRFAPLTFAPLGTSEFVTPASQRHTYSFFEKRAA